MTSTIIAKTHKILDELGYMEFDPLLKTILEEAQKDKPDLEAVNQVIMKFYENLGLAK